jgi:hypothetical protein
LICWNYSEENVVILYIKDFLVHSNISLICKSNELRSYRLLLYITSNQSKELGTEELKRFKELSGIIIEIRNTYFRINWINWLYYWWKENLGIANNLIFIPHNRTARFVGMLWKKMLYI